jgi:hypothetical protein
MPSNKERLDKFYEKIPGSYWAIIGGVFGLLVFLIASILHSLTEPITFFTHFVSHLGWGPNGSEPVFRIGIVILSCLVAPYIIYLDRLLRVEKGEKHYKMSKLAFISSILSLVGLLMISIWGNIHQEGFFLHLVGALLYFVMAMGFMLFYTMLMVYSGRRSKIQLACTLVNLSFAVLMMISVIPLATGIDQDFISQLGSMNIEDMLVVAIPYTMWLTFFEWLYILGTCVWFIITGIFTLKIERA